MNWLKAHWKASIAALVLLVGMAWYSRPVDIHGLTSQADTPDYITIFIKEFPSGQAYDAVLAPETPEWSALMEEIEAFRFRRPPWNLILQFLDKNVATGRQVRQGDYEIMLYLNEPQGNVFQLHFFIDTWKYYSPYSNRGLTLWMDDGREAANALVNIFSLK